MIIDPRVFNAKTVVSKYHFALLPVEVFFLRINGKTFSTTDLSFAYHQVPLTPETQKLVRIVVGNEQYKFKRGCYSLNVLSGSSNRIMIILFAQLIKQNEIIRYFDDVSVQTENKNQMFEQLWNFPEPLGNYKLKAAPNRTLFFSMLLNVSAKTKLNL